MSATALDAVVFVLRQIPYGQVAETIRLLDAGTRPYRPEIRNLSALEQKHNDFLDAVFEAIRALNEHCKDRIDGDGQLALKLVVKRLQECAKAALLDQFATEPTGEQNVPH